ncbi:lipopolysaccharide biosynthesis protein [Aquipseudomonas ullengensis]|uniref:Membrane protein involved in the export of O-antigen and teichoic acid n=1 Tax=Aquipseudomonas ullengensis TaxID=2759166 RepID=A0A7W4LI73_9GAMM|nr:hypothetical protein [Pseudomonas ullengensis]MBB2493537.1 hypothetical protein [Pseudomonas ullengensis]
MGVLRQLLSLRERVGGAVFVLLGQGAQSVGSFVTGLIIARAAGQEELGLFALGYSFCFLVICLGDTLVATPYTYFSSHEDKHQSGILRAGLLGTFLVGLLVCILIVIAAALGVESLRGLVFTLPFAVIGLVLREFVRRHLYVAGKLTSALLKDLLSCALQLVLVLLLAGFNELSANSAFVAIGVAALLPVLVFLVRGVFAGHVSTVAEMAGWLMQFFGYGRWLVLGTACHVASIQLYPWLALAGGGARNAGVFAVCVALTNLMNPLLVGLTNYFRPKLMASYREVSSADFFRQILRVSMLFLVPAVFFLLVVSVEGDRLLVFVYGETYREGASALFYMGFGMVAVALSAPLQLALLAVRAPVTNLIYHASALFALLFLSAIFWPHLTTTLLGSFYGGVNFAALAVLFFLFWGRVVSR